MATGIEIAGLVLGGIPILVLALDSMRQMRNYESEITTIKRELKTEQAFFRDICEKLFSGILSLADLERIGKDPNFSAYVSERYEGKLRIRLGGSYEVFLACVEDMNNTLQEICKNLKLEDNDKPLGSNRSFFDIVNMGPLKYTFHHKRYERVSRKLRDQNTRLFGLITINVELEPLRKQQFGPMKYFESARQNSSAMYSILSSCWSCSCPGRHEAGLVLQTERREADAIETSARLSDSSQDDLLLNISKDYDDPTEWSYIRIAARPNDPEGKTPDCATGEVAEANAPESSSRETERNIPKPKHGLFPFRLKFNNNEGWANPVSRGMLFPAKRRENMPKTLEAAKATMKQPNMPNKASNHSNEGNIEILDLCSALQNDFLSCQLQSQQAPGYGPLLGFIKLTDTEKIGVYPIRGFSNTASRPVTLSLEEIFAGEYAEEQESTNTTAINMTHANLKDAGVTLRHKILSPPNRYLLSLKLASSVLGLYDTPWLGPNWSKTNIFVSEQVSKNTDLCISISRKFPSLSSDEVERDPVKFSFCRNSTLFALGVLLIEISLECSLQSLRTTDDPLDKFGRANIITDWSTASRASNLVLEKSGTRYWEAVRRCIWTDFDMNKTSLHDADFRSAFYQGVVDPLRRVCEDYRL